MTHSWSPANPNPDSSINSARFGNGLSQVHHTMESGANLQPLRRRAWTPKEVAEQLGVPYETILDLIHTNRIGATKAGRYYLIPDVEVERFLDCARKAA